MVLRQSLAYALRRLAQAVPTVLVIVALNFLLLQLAPGDAADVLAGEAGSATPEFMAQLRKTFGLDQQVAPNDDELAHASASLTGRNRALLDTVSAAIKEDVLRIKDALDLHLRTGRQDVEVLRPQALQCRRLPR